MATGSPAATAAAAVSSPTQSLSDSSHRMERGEEVEGASWAAAVLRSRPHEGSNRSTMAMTSTPATRPNTSQPRDPPMLVKWPNPVVRRLPPSRKGYITRDLAGRGRVKVESAPDDGVLGVRAWPGWRCPAEPWAYTEAKVVERRRRRSLSLGATAASSPDIE